MQFFSFIDDNSSRGDMYLCVDVYVCVYVC